MIPTEFTKRYYSIGEAAALFELKTSTLRFWEKEFPELQPKKSESGARKYTAKDMEKLRQIHYLVKERGFTLEGARAKLRHSIALKDMAMACSGASATSGHDSIASFRT